MGILSKIFGAGDVINQVGKLADRFIRTGDEKDKFMLEMESLIQVRDANIEETVRAQIQGRERVLIAELQQGDTYTKRARPTVIYYGLFMITLERFLPLLAIKYGLEPDALQLPTGFWAAWGGIASSWVIGRSAERVGHSNKLLRWISGNKQKQLKDEW